MQYPKILKFEVWLENERDALTLDQYSSALHAAYMYALEERQHFTDPNEVNGPLWHPTKDATEIGWWDLTLAPQRKRSRAAKASRSKK